MKSKHYTSIKLCGFSEHIKTAEQIAEMIEGLQTYCFLCFDRFNTDKETFLQLFKASYNLDTPRNKYYFELFEKFDFTISWQKGGYCFEILN